MTHAFLLVLSTFFHADTRPDDRMVGVLVGHKNSICSVAFSPDGKTVASGTWGSARKPGEFKLWDFQKAVELTSETGDTAIRGIEFSPDGKFIATAEHDKTAKLRDAKTGKVLKVFKGHAGGVDTVTFLDGGKILATSSWDKTVKLWDVESGKELRTFNGHEGQVFAVARSPDSKLLASAGARGVLKIWEAGTGKEVHSIAAHKGTINSVAFADKGKVVATGSWDKTVKLFDVESGKELAVLLGHYTQVLTVAGSPDGKWLASVGGKWTGADSAESGVSELILWDVAGRKQVVNVNAHRERIFGLAFSPDSETVATASSDGLIKLWSVAKLVKSANKE